MNNLDWLRLCLDLLGLLYDGLGAKLHELLRLLPQLLLDVHVTHHGVGFFCFGHLERLIISRNHDGLVNFEVET